ncbi:hypothetical protein [Thalassiella azotivora]
MQDGSGRTAPLRHLALAVSVLADIDLDPRDEGVALTEHPDVLVPWSVVADVVAGHPPDRGVARTRLTQWLRLRLLVAELGPEAPAVLRPAARALALPHGHALAQDDGWVREPLLGDALVCGVGLLGLLDDPLEVVPLPTGVAAAAGVDPAAWWPSVREHAEGMGHLVVQRLRRDRGPRQQVLRPVGGVDVPSLLLSGALRRHLAEDDGSGMRALAVPMRTRGWYDLARIDPAFVGAAWSATAEVARGLAAPVLVTADEVSLGLTGGDVREALADPVRDERPRGWGRDVRYR